jgi:hypothetical protein
MSGSIGVASLGDSMTCLQLLNLLDVEQGQLGIVSADRTTCQHVTHLYSTPYATGHSNSLTVHDLDLNLRMSYQYLIDPYK